MILFQSCLSAPKQDSLILLCFASSSLLVLVSIYQLPSVLDTNIQYFIAYYVFVI